MADDSSKAAGSKPRAGAGDRASRRTSRLKVAGKLTGLLGLPLLVIFGIFASGVYCGVTRADQVVELEQRWLGIEPPEGRLLGAAAPAGPAEPAAEGPRAPESNVEPTVVSDDAGQTGVEPKPAVEPTVDDPTAPAVVDPTPNAPAEPSNKQLPLAKAGPVGPELTQLFDETRVARLKIMVDPALVVAREDWLGYTAELFEATRASYELLFGIELQLQGIVVWDAALGADADALLADLAGRERDGADLVVGLVAREQPAGFVATPWTKDVNGDHALVFADLQQNDRYYRSLLRALALVFGAEPALDPAAQQLGSFMTDVHPPAGTAPVIDPGNRGRVVIKKSRPFASGAAKLDKPAKPAKPAKSKPADADADADADPDTDTDTDAGEGI